MIHTFNGISQHELLQHAASLEQHQSHPIAKAILQAAHESGTILDRVDDVNYKLGNGVKGVLREKSIHIGSRRFLESEKIDVPTEATLAENRIHEQGLSNVMIAIDNQIVGLLELHPIIRAEAKETVEALQERDMELYIISGDDEAPTRSLANELGITNYFAEVLPEDKAHLVEQLQGEGRSVCFVGDGINDSIALKRANVSISIAGATTVATDTAHIILMKGDLTQLLDIFGVVESYATDLRTYYKVAIIPGAICTAGTFLLGWGFLTSILAAQGSTFWGLAKVIREMQQDDQTTLSSLDIDPKHPQPMPHISPVQ